MKGLLLPGTFFWFIFNKKTSSRTWFHLPLTVGVFYSFHLLQGSKRHGHADVCSYKIFSVGAKLEMCTTKLEKSCNFVIFKCFLLVFTPVMQLFRHFLRNLLRKIPKSESLKKYLCDFWKLF